jgi:hypothetical protein
MLPTIMHRNILVQIKLGTAPDPQCCLSPSSERVQAIGISRRHSNEIHAILIPAAASIASAAFMQNIGIGWLAAK